MATIKKLNIAKWTGSVYFLGLAILNLVLDYQSSKFSLFDLILLLITVIPLLIGKRTLFLVYGFLTSVICLAYAIAIFSFNVQAAYANKLHPLMEYLAQYGFMALSMFCALLLVYVGLHTVENLNQRQPLGTVN